DRQAGGSVCRRSKAPMFGPGNILAPLYGRVLGWPAIDRRVARSAGVQRRQCSVLATYWRLCTGGCSVGRRSTGGWLGVPAFKGANVRSWQHIGAFVRAGARLAVDKR